MQGDSVIPTRYCYHHFWNSIDNTTLNSVLDNSLEQKHRVREVNNIIEEWWWDVAQCSDISSYSISIESWVWLPQSFSLLSHLVNSAWHCYHMFRMVFKLWTVQCIVQNKDTLSAVHPTVPILSIMLLIFPLQRPNWIFLPLKQPEDLFVSHDDLWLLSLLCGNNLSLQVSCEEHAHRTSTCSALCRLQHGCGKWKHCSPVNVKN